MQNAGANDANLECEQVRQHDTRAFLIWLKVENISDLSIWRYRVKINLKTHYLSLVKSDKE